MEVTKESIGQAIVALRQCAKEHKNDKIDTGKIIVTSLCNDVADYLEKIKNLSFIEMPSEEEWKQIANSLNNGFEDSQSSGIREAYNYFKSKIVK